MERRLLFVAGVARSGTTALTRLLTSHPEVALGMERYKLLVLHGTGADLVPELFEPDRFFDFRADQTTLTPDASPRWEVYYRELAQKYATATYVGDKVTDLRVRRLLQRFPGARVVAIVRDPVEVAASWQRRADDSDDSGWRSSRGAPEAIVEWNRGVRRLLRTLDRADGRIRVVEHGGLFGDPDDNALSGLLDWLALPRSSAQDAAFAEMVHHFRTRVRDRPAGLPAEVAATVAATADQQAWDAVRRRADEDAAGGASTPT